jgi:hypothetical protein
MSYLESAICPRKYEARLKTIIEPYRYKFGKSIPEDKQYWTVAGPNYLDNGYISPGSELYQMIESGLITEEQFIGVNNVWEITEKNRKLNTKATFHFGDMLQVIEDEDDFRPSIINCDFTRLIKRSVIDIANLFYLLKQRDVEDCMIILNFPLVNAHNPNLEDIDCDSAALRAIEIIKNYDRFTRSWNDKCSLYPEYYIYCGTGERSRTKMCSVIMFR